MTFNPKLILMKYGVLVTVSSRSIKELRCRQCLWNCQRVSCRVVGAIVVEVVALLFGGYKIKSVAL